MVPLDNKREPLVSVVVVTYNSSQTVIETLESIKAQTYKNIELVISDDDSKDTSVEICKKWVEKNKNRFVRTKIITHTPNTGTSANMNRAFSEAQGEWIKVIAADDKLLPNCISDYVDYVNSHPDANIVLSRVVGFGNMEAAKQWPWLNVKRFFDNLTPYQFRIVLSAQNFLPAASVFLKKSVWKGLGGYDESIPLLEDWPFWVKAMSNGYIFDFMDKETVAYRFSEMSISQGIVVLSERYLESYRKASVYARRSLNDLGFSYIYLYLTRRLLMIHLPGISKLVFILNVFNPTYYKYRNTLLLFKKLQFCETT
jgi:alpha-1,3-rhamnosyltransferase